MLLQGDAPKSALLEEFRLTPNAVLFATSSFWQGVDVQGERLSSPSSSTGCRSLFRVIRSWPRG